MKICTRCGGQNEDTANFCAFCGTSEFQAAEAVPVAQEPVIPTDPVAPVAPVWSDPAAEAIPDAGNGNIVAGIVGALLFSLAGVLLYLLIYQAGVIAGISGLVMFLLANFGYGLFSRGKKNSMAGLIVALVVTVVMIFAAEYVSLSFEIVKAFDDGLTIFDAMRLLPSFLSDPEISGGMVRDLAFAYIFGLLAAGSQFVTLRKLAKTAEAGKNPVQ